MAASKNGVRRRTQKSSPNTRAVARATRDVTNRVAGELAGAITSIARAASGPLPSAPVGTDLVSELNNIDFGKMR